MEPRPRALGRARGPAPRAPRVFLGRRQDRDRPPAPPHLGRLAHPLPRRQGHGCRSDLPARARAARDRESGARARADERVGVRAGGAIRALRRRRQRGLSVRVAPRSRSRHAPRLLRSSRHEPVRRDSKPLGTPRAPHPGRLEASGEPVG